MKIFVDVHFTDDDLEGSSADVLRVALDNLLTVASEVRLHLWAVTAVDPSAQAALRDFILSAELRDQRVAVVDPSYAAKIALGTDVPASPASRQT